MKPLIRKPLPAGSITSTTQTVRHFTTTSPVSSKPLVLSRPVIAVTGSAGKSTTKEMIASILRRKWRVLKTVDNRNFINHTRQYRAQVRSFHDALVLEYGLFYKGDIRRHCSIIKPNIGVITNVGTAHIGNFGGSVKRLAKAKSELIQHMVQTGTLVINGDDPNSKWLLTRSFRGTILTAGIRSSDADYRASDVQMVKGGTRFNVTLDDVSESFFVPIYGEHNVYNALMAIAVAHVLGVTPTQMRSGLRRYFRMGHRLIVYRLPTGTLLIDDSYSANPNATKAALNVLSNVGKGVNVAVLGDMMSLGAYTRKGHRDVGTHVAKSNVHYLFTYGKAADEIGKSAIRAGFSREHVHHFSTLASLNRAVWNVCDKNTTLLVKGSHDMHMRQTVAYLRRKAEKRTSHLKGTRG